MVKLGYIKLFSNKPYYKFFDGIRNELDSYKT